MKTPKEWLAQIKQASDTEPRHGSSVILLESDIEAIQEEARDHAEMCFQARLELHREAIYLEIRDHYYNP